MITRRNKKQQDLKGWKMFLGAIALSTMMVACSQDDGKQQELYRQVEARISGLEHQLDERDSTINDFMVSFDGIEANLEIIRQREEKLRDMAEGEEYLGNQADRIRRDIGLINTLMAENAEQLRGLRQRLNASGVKIRGLERKLKELDAENSRKDLSIAELRDLLTARDGEIEGLNAELTQREVQIVLQETLIENQEEIIDAQDEALHKVYIATGSMKELKDRGIVRKEGSFLGMGGDKKINGDVSEEEFLTMDMRESTEIPLFTKKAKLISAHPEGTYTFTVDGDGQIEKLEILEPDKFWETSRYLVVATN